MKLLHDRATYDRLFAAEQAVDYPMVDCYEARLGYAMPDALLLRAARVLACPVKAHPPNWQHGRVIYAAASARLARLSFDESVTLVDIGTAKGFSALCLLYAIDQHELSGRVISVDVIDPTSRTLRNTVAECDGLKTLAEILEPWPEAERIDFRHATGIDALKSLRESVPVAFIDGKHDEQVVTEEGRILAAHQRAGDLAIIDDYQIRGIQSAVNKLSDVYNFEFLRLHPIADRAYAIGLRR